MKFDFNVASKSNKTVIKESRVYRTGELITKTCKSCGKEFQVPKWYGTGDYCSKECADMSKRAKPNVKCAVCGKEFHLKESAIKKNKSGYFTCSKECMGKLRTQIYAGTNNPNYKTNSISIYYNNGFKYQKIKLHSYHPYKDKNDYYPYHRYVIEQNHKLFDDKYFNIIDNKYYLKPEIIVHHIDENGLHNNIENLIPLTRSEHTSFHNSNKIIQRDNLGKITGVVKCGELLENHKDNDNQQPSNNSNIIEGSTTNNRIQTDKAEDSNVDTSAVPINFNSDDIV